MMLSPAESFFVRLLRITVVATAGLALLSAILALGAAAMAYFAPEPQAELSSQIERLRNATDPSKLMTSLFDGTAVMAGANEEGKVVYKFSGASDDELFAEFNSFLKNSINGHFQDEDLFKSWLYSGDRIPFTWNEDIDNPNAQDEDSVTRLTRSLLLDYAKRLNAWAPALRKANDEKLYPTAFEKLMAPTGSNNAPNFLVWFFNSLQTELATISDELTTARQKHEAQRQLIPIELEAAGVAYTYFLFMMFLFLVISVEASARRIAESKKALGGSLVD